MNTVKNSVIGRRHLILVFSAWASILGFWFLLWDQTYPFAFNWSYEVRMGVHYWVSLAGLVLALLGLAAMAVTSIVLSMTDSLSQLALSGVFLLVVAALLYQIGFSFGLGSGWSQVIYLPARVGALSSALCLAVAGLRWARHRL